MTKQELLQANENDIVVITNQQGVEEGMRRIIQRNMSLLPKTVETERIITSAGFYISNRNDLLALDNSGKLKMLYGILKEAIVGNIAGEDFDIIVYGNKPFMSRTREGWYRIIELVKPAEIVKFVVNVATTGDEISYNPATETLKHEMHGERKQTYDDIIGAYAYIKFANKFEKTVYMTKSDLDFLKSKSPSANGSKPHLSPWNSNSIRMVKTKVAKELAKELYSLFKGKLNRHIQQVAMIDDAPISRITSDGCVTLDTQPLQATPINTQPFEDRAYDVPASQNIPVQDEVLGAFDETIPDEEFDMNAI